MLNQLKRSLSLIFGLILCINSIWLLSQGQRHFGIALSIIIAVALILYALLFSSIQRWQQNSRFRTLFWNSLWSGFLFWMISVAIFFAYIQMSINSNIPARPAAAILVLGSGINQGQPSPILKNRLDTAAKYAEQYPNTLMIMTGGRNFREKQSEAEVMQNYIHTNYPQLKNPMSLEDQSRSTQQNLQYAQAILKQQNIGQNEPIAIVTSDFHSPRARAIASYQGYQQVISLSASTPQNVRYNSWLREYFALISGWLLNEYSLFQ
ncbi:MULTISPECIES: YdcF family protein [unclassified Acinetobacter]|uniref:YdcF family protein n=1 Tax=unclassified Acinetobacter TaxID=196816 RepID=UPI001C21573F|nr:MULTISPECIES: YdcF family protein [unclassified Acinetobacter]